MRPIGYQLYSSRHFRPLTDTLRMVSEMGYDQVEGYNGLFRSGADVVALRSALTAFHLSMPSAHITLHKIQSLPDRIIALSESVGISAIVVSNLPSMQRPHTPEDWTELGAEIRIAAAPLRDAGLAVVYHNLDVELYDLGDGSTALDRLLDSDPELLLQFDPAWAHRAGFNPLNIISKYGSKMRSAHIKDVAARGNNALESGWADVGQGVLAWDGIWAALNKEGVPFRMIEHNNPADHWRFAQRSIDIVRELDARVTA